MTPWTAYKLRWKRRRLLWRALRSRHALTPVKKDVPSEGVLAISCVRNEMGRLPFWLAHHRSLGVQHFLIIDNASDDGTDVFLAKQPDVSLWRTEADYRQARFGLDWQNWLLMAYGHNRWCLTIDADELFVYAHHEEKGLDLLTAWLDSERRRVFGALMLDLFPREPLGQGSLPDNPLEYLAFFDAGPFRNQRQEPMQNLWTQGGTRERAFFAETPRLSPTLNKLPLVRWNRRHVYVNSTHSALPRGLNLAYDGPGGDAPSGALLHTKFLPEVIEKSTEDLKRQQHFYDPAQYQAYYDRILDAPSLWHPDAHHYVGWEQLVELGLITPGNFGKY